VNPFNEEQPIIDYLERDRGEDYSDFDDGAPDYYDGPEDDDDE
jgi:hypothetical protein